MWVWGKEKMVKRKNVGASVDETFKVFEIGVS